MKKFLIAHFCLLFLALNVSAQDDLLSLLGEEEETTDYATASFKTNRVINLHSLESTARGGDSCRRRQPKANGACV